VFVGGGKKQGRKIPEHVWKASKRIEAGEGEYSRADKPKERVPDKMKTGKKGDCGKEGVGGGHAEDRGGAKKTAGAEKRTISKRPLG